MPLPFLGGRAPTSGKGRELLFFDHFSLSLCKSNDSLQRLRAGVVQAAAAGVSLTSTTNAPQCCSTPPCCSQAPLPRPPPDPCHSCYFRSACPPTLPVHLSLPTCCTPCDLSSGLHVPSCDPASQSPTCYFPPSSAAASLHQTCCVQGVVLGWGY